MPARSRLGQTAAYALAALILIVAGVSLASAVSDPLLRLAIVGVVSSLVMTAIALAAASRSRSGMRDALGWTRSSSRLGRAHVAVLTLGAVGASHLLDAAIDSLGIREASVLAELDMLLGGARGLPLALVVLGVGIAPGFGEELLFRGVLLRGVARRHGVAVGLVASSLLFGALHIDPVQGGAAALLGLYLGGVAIAADGTRIAIGCHVANNLVAVLGAALADGDASRGPDRSDWLLVAAGAALLAGLVVLARTIPEGVSWWQGNRQSSGPSIPEQDESVRAGEVVGELVAGVERDAEQDAPEHE